MKAKSKLIIEAEKAIKKFNLSVTIDNIDTKSAYGSVSNPFHSERMRLVRITILYLSQSVVFTDLNTQEQLIKTC
jgi:hypothetical protein